MPLSITSEDRERIKKLRLKLLSLMMTGFIFLIGGVSYFMYGCITKTGTASKLPISVIFMTVGISAIFFGLLLKIETKFLQKYIGNKE